MRRSPDRHHFNGQGLGSNNGVAPMDEEKERLLRAYAGGDITWTALREYGFENYVQVLGGLGELGLRQPVAPMEGPNVAARQRGRAIIREALKAAHS